MGGYVTRQLKRWPRAGDAVALGPYEVRVTAAQQNRVQQVMISPPSAAAAATAATNGPAVPPPVTRAG